MRSFVRARAIRDGVFARQRAAPANVLVVLELDLAALNRRPPGPARPASARGGGAPGSCRAATRRGRPPPDPLNVQQEHVGRVGDMSTANCAIRFSCSDRTPMMKKLPSPTASRTMRTWLPGRLNCSTACRSANQRDRASGLINLISRTPARCSTTAVAANPTVTTSPTRQDPACHTVSSTSAAATKPTARDLHQRRAGGTWTRRAAAATV